MRIRELFTNLNPDKIGRNLIILAFIGLLVISISFSYDILIPTIVPIGLVLSILLTLLIIFINTNKNNKPIPFQLFLIILLGYCCIELIMGLLKNDPKLALQEFAPFLFILFIPVFAYFYSDIKQIRIIILILFSTILLPCIFWLFGIPLIYGKFMPIIALAFVPFLLYSTNKWNITFITAGSIILLSAVFAMQTGSRGAWIALSGMIIFFIVISIFNVKETYLLNTKKGIIYSALILFIILASSMFWNPSVYPRIISVINMITNTQQPALQVLNVKPMVTQKTNLSFVANLEQKGFLHEEAVDIASIGGVSEQEITAMIDKLLNNFYIGEIKDITITACNIDDYNKRQNYIQHLIEARKNPTLYGSKLSLDTKIGMATNNATWRYIIWKDALAEWSKKPFTGYGFGHAFYSKTLKELNWTGASRPQNPHNAYVHILYMLGLIGFILFIGFFISVFWYGIKNIQNSKNLEIKLLNISLLNSMIYILILSFVDPVIEYPQISIFLWLAIGLLIASSRLSLNATNSDTANEN